MGSLYLQKKFREVTRGQGRAQWVPKGVSRKSEERPGEGGAWGRAEDRKGDTRKCLGPEASESQTTRLRRRRQREKFTAKTFKKKRLVFEFEGSSGQPIFEKGVWGCGARCAPSRAVPSPGSILLASSAPQPLTSPSSPRGQARFCPQFHSRVTDSTLVGATSCGSTGHTAERREGKAVFIVVCFASFHPGLGRGRARSQCPGSMSGSLTSPHGQHREAFLPHRTPQPPRAQPQCNRAGAPGMPGFVVLSGPLGRVGVRVP